MTTTRIQIQYFFFAHCDQGSGAYRWLSVQIRAVADWIPYRETYLDELLRHDGRGSNAALMCSNVGCGGDGIFKCRECMFENLFCCDCMVRRHSNLPLHRILVSAASCSLFFFFNSKALRQKWEGSFFDDASLHDLGLVIQLGHDGNSCRSPGTLVRGFSVLDNSGLHLVNLKFCDCNHKVGASHPRIQLLRVGWFPATLMHPQHAYTFDVLDTFHHLNLQGKISAFNFYCGLAHKTNNVDMSDVKVCSACCRYMLTNKPQYRYRQFLYGIRIWRHLKALKRAGRGHDPAGVAATVAGQCAVECPACPHPGKNLPSNWATAKKRWMHTLRLTVDANFKLKNKARGIMNDPPLGDGWGHWVPERPYQAYLDKFGHQEEVCCFLQIGLMSDICKQPNLCQSELRAVDHANKRFSDRYLASGAAAVVCARHGLVRKNGMGSLQKGERSALFSATVL
jgi:hypothetical protein